MTGPAGGAIPFYTMSKSICENTCEDELARLKEICANLEYDLEKTRQWAVSCEKQLDSWKNGPDPKKPDEPVEEGKQTDSEMLEELRNSYADLSHDYNNLDKDYENLKKTYDELKAEHDALIVALEN